MQQETGGRVSQLTFLGRGCGASQQALGKGPVFHGLRHWVRRLATREYSATLCVPCYLDSGWETQIKMYDHVPGTEKESY